MNINLIRRPLGCLKTSLRQSRQQRLLFPLSTRSMTTATEPTSTSSGPAPDQNFFRITDPRTKKTRTAFAIYPPIITAPRTPPPDPKAAEVKDQEERPPNRRARRAAERAAREAAEGTGPPPPILHSKPPPPTPGPLSITLSPTHPTPLQTWHEQQMKYFDPTGARTRLFSKYRRGAAKVGDVLMVTLRRGGEPLSGVLLSVRRRGIDTAMLLRTALTRVGVELWLKVYSTTIVGIEVIKRRERRARRARLYYMRHPKHDMGNVDHFVDDWYRSRKVMNTKGSKADLEAKARRQGSSAKK